MTIPSPLSSRAKQSTVRRASTSPLILKGTGLRWVGEWQVQKRYYSRKVGISRKDVDALGARNHNVLPEVPAFSDPVHFGQGGCHVWVLTTHHLKMAFAKPLDRE